MCELALSKWVYGPFNYRGNACYDLHFVSTTVSKETTLNTIFIVTHYLDLNNAIYSYHWWIFYQVKSLMFYSVQTINVHICW